MTDLAFPPEPAPPAKPWGQRARESWPGLTQEALDTYRQAWTA